MSRTFGGHYFYLRSGLMLSYSEKIKNTRDALGMTQYQLGEAIGVTRKYISTLENPTNTNKRLSRQKEATLIRIAGLPPRYFDEDNVSTEHVSNEDIVYAMMPEVKAADLTISDVRAMLKPLASRKVSQ
jgi:transcriptional regulator with XRE-family HTH domain